MSDTTRTLTAADRGVSEVIGAILVFGLVVVALVAFQTSAVPAANERVEFDHNQQVQADLLGLDATIADAAAGRGGTAVVTTGMDYPPRFLFRNPPPVSGSLRTGTSEFTVANAVAVGDRETADYWNGDGRAYESRRLVYRVDYNVYDGAPTTVLAHGVAYDRFPNGNHRRIDAGGPIDGRTVGLTALDGRRNASRVGPVSVPVTPRSAETRTVRVTDAGEPVTLTLRTAAPPAAWEGFLADELVANGGHVESVTDGPTDGTVNVVLEQGVTYELRLAALSVGSGGTAPAPEYLTAVGPTDAALTTSESRALTVEVRDRYNGPVAGEPVTFTADGGSFAGGGTTSTVVTDDDGRATVTVTPDGAGEVTVTATGDPDADGTVQQHERVPFTLTATDPAGGGGGSGSACTVPDWSSADPSRRFENAEECVWAGIDGANSLALSDPALTPQRRDGEAKQDEQYLRLTMVVSDGDTHYLVEVTESKEGVTRKYGGDWSRRKVHVHRRTGDSDYERIADVELSSTALESWYQGTEPLDLLDRQSYEANSQGVVELRNFMRGNEVSVRIVENDGGVTVTATTAQGGSQGGGQGQGGNQGGGR